MKRPKLTYIFAIFLILMLGITGCAKKGICDACGKKAVLYKFTTTASLLGFEQSNTSNLCSDCLDDAIKAAESDPLTTFTYEKIE